MALTGELESKPRIYFSSKIFSIYSSIRAPFISSCSATQMQFNRKSSLRSRITAYCCYFDVFPFHFLIVSRMSKSRPKSRSNWGLRKFRYDKYDILGSSVVDPNLIKNLRMSWSRMRSLFSSSLMSLIFYKVRRGQDDLCWWDRVLQIQLQVKSH